MSQPTKDVTPKVRPLTTQGLARSAQCQRGELDRVVLCAQPGERLNEDRRVGLVLPASRRYSIPPKMSNRPATARYEAGSKLPSLCLPGSCLGTMDLMSLDPNPIYAPCRRWLPLSWYLPLMGRVGQFDAVVNRETGDGARRCIPPGHLGIPIGDFALIHVTSDRREVSWCQHGLSIDARL